MNTIILFNGDLELSVQQNSATNNYELVLENVSSVVSTIDVDVTLEYQVNPPNQVLSNLYSVVVNSSTVIINNLGSLNGGKYVIYLTINKGSSSEKTKRVGLVIPEHSLIEKEPYLDGILGGIIAVIAGLQNTQHKSTFTNFLGNQEITIKFRKVGESSDYLTIVIAPVTNPKMTFTINIENFPKGEYNVTYEVKITEEIILDEEANGYNFTVS